MTQIVQNCLLVALGGALGTLARYGIGIAAAKLLGKGFPWGTLIVNVGGCFAMGVVLGAIASWESQSPEAMTPDIRGRIELWRTFLAVGLLGGLTTFSSFGGDTIRELQGGQPGIAVANVVSNVALSLVAVWCGLATMRMAD
ncbi:MAG TPA: CrcB family protein [Pirellulaceae bacterium]|nr:CrcB family protein [Pirellulaceae bacterium]